VKRRGLVDKASERCSHNFRPSRRATIPQFSHILFDSAGATHPTLDKSVVLM